MIKTAILDTRSIWSEGELISTFNGTELLWKDVTEMTGVPVMLALLRHQRNVTVCSIQAHWTTTSQWILSTSNHDVATNFTFMKKTDTVLYIFGYSFTRIMRDIHLHENWVTALNPANGSVKLLEALLNYGLQTSNYTARPTSSTYTDRVPDSANLFFSNIVSQVLAKAIANGLSRFGAQYATDHFKKGTSVKSLTICNDEVNWCSEGHWFPRLSIPLAVVPNISLQESATAFDSNYDTSWLNDTSPLLRSFSKPADADEKWTRISFPVKNYGYAYSFRGITMYLSVAVLCLHAAMVLAHVVYRVAFDCQIFNFGGSLGELLVLAMGDKAPVGKKMWAERMIVVPVEHVEEKRKFKPEVIGKREDTVQDTDLEAVTLLTKRRTN